MVLIITDFEPIEEVAPEGNDQGQMPKDK